MKAFYGDPAIKEKYMARLRAHYAADEIVKGLYWEHGKGCAVGCTIHGNDHGAYEIELQIPMVLAHLEDSIFESLENHFAKEFPLKFLSAIKVGADTSLVFYRFVHWLLVDPVDGVIRFSNSKKAIEDVADLFFKKINGEEISYDQWSTAADAAADAAGGAAGGAAYAARASYAAAYAARAADAADAADAAAAAARASAYAARAADAAARAARAADAADAADAAAAAARASAYAARAADAAARAARAAARAARAADAAGKRQAEKLIDLLEACV